MQKSLKKVLSAVQARPVAHSTIRRSPIPSGIKIQQMFRAMSTQMTPGKLTDFQGEEFDEEAFHLSEE
ncbi:Oidioi.mRNA.OKI2018_I69.chr1.g2831.t1.cds [Oikopleura dioica]|uniref:Oidioi.mRNA.OKI2018_I69.chr1.g2831.t1.cds n=1 Tax=Oikopleura dioica TaxID=34765 RepID=A0ABN7SSB0_OIKDI|nr:Oidioi.mRNA.OKI2018_I69.chr1.g2831.t1.cds [Oikopleura dioica]